MLEPWPTRLGVPNPGWIVNMSTVLSTDIEGPKRAQVRVGVGAKEGW